MEKICSPSDRVFTEQYARPGYEYLYPVERYEGQERSDVEISAATSLEGREYYVDWNNVRTPAFMRDRAAMPQVTNGVEAAKFRRDPKIVELGSLFVKK